MLVGAIIKTESASKTDAVRYEPGYKWLYKVEESAKRVKITKVTEKAMQMTSWGLMQVMGGVARENGHLGPMHKLCDPKTGIKFGARHLLGYLKRYGNIEDAVSAYNQGSPRKNKDGTYKNQEYVDKVMKDYKLLKEVYEIIGGL